MADRLFITFIALFILFGLAFSQTDDEYWHNLFGGLAILCMGVFGISGGWSSVLKGEIKPRRARILREERPVSFWLATGMILSCGVILSVAGIWILFFRESVGSV